MISVAKKMKLSTFFTLLMLSIFIELRNGLFIETKCDYSNITITQERPERRYITCETISLEQLNDFVLYNVETNLSSLNFSIFDIEALIVKDGAENLSYVPPNVYFFFPNLRLLHIENTKLEHVTPANLKQFPKLQTFVSIGNSITILPANLFSDNPEMIEFVVVGSDNYSRDNSLHTIEENLLINATKMEVVIFRNNFCVNEIALNRTQVVELSERLHFYCSGGFSTSTPTPTLTTTQVTSETSQSTTTFSTQATSQPSTTSDGSAIFLNKITMQSVAFLNFFIVVNYLRKMDKQ